MDKTFPAFSDLRQASKIRERLNERTASGLNAWISVASARQPGLVLHSNDDGGFDFHYGSGTSAGASGRTWGGTAVGGGEQGYYPAAYVDSLEIDGNYDDLSRKASFTLVAHTQTQANELITHFLEPGYTVFLQWGWNTDGGNGGLIRKLGDNISKIASYTNQKKSDVARSDSTWEYDNYVGFISGGNVTLEGNKWKISVQCYGFTELPMQLKVADTVYKTTEIQQGGQGGEMYQASEIYSNRNNANGRFMMMFNELPSNKRTSFVKQKLYGDSYMKKIVNYINFDASVLEAVANKASFSFSSKIASAWAALTEGFSVASADGNVIQGAASATVSFFKSLFSGTTVDTGEGDETEIEAGVKLVHEERFIRFGALIRIINSTGAKGYKLKDGTRVVFKIDSNGVIISAFERIFSTKKQILFIPNPRTPRFSIKFALENTVAQTDFTGEPKNNTVTALNDTVIFPQPTAKTYNPPHADGTGISRNAYTWGYLDDLYVNFDFAMEIIKTKNLSMRDAIIQILNGLSTAAGGIWDFQLIDSVDENGNLTIRIEDFNLTSSTPVTPSATFDISGPKCPFIDTSMDMDISGDVMNSIVGERNSDSAKMNSSDVSQKGQAGTKVEDFILTAVETDKSTNGGGTPTANNVSTLPEEEQAIAQKRNYEKFMELVGIYPKVKYTAAGIDTKSNLDDITYIGALDDLAVFESFKLASDTSKVDKKGVGPLIPINFTFTVHGVSGVRLGDTFKINGLVGSYSEGGFFQVTSVKHSISGMVWTTSITGGWRPER
jgi:hypothetical protein